MAYLVEMPTGLKTKVADLKENAADLTRMAIDLVLMSKDLHFYSERLRCVEWKKYYKNDKSFVDWEWMGRKFYHKFLAKKSTKFLW